MHKVVYVPRLPCSFQPGINSTQVQHVQCSCKVHYGFISVQGQTKQFTNMRMLQLLLYFCCNPVMWFDEYPNLTAGLLSENTLFESLKTRKTVFLSVLDTSYNVIQFIITNLAAMNVSNLNIQIEQFLFIELKM